MGAIDDKRAGGMQRDINKSPYESLRLFLVAGDQKEPAFLMPLRDFKEGEKICLFK